MLENENISRNLIFPASHEKLQTKISFNLEIQKLHFQGKRISQIIFGTI